MLGGEQAFGRSKMVSKRLIARLSGRRFHPFFTAIQRDVHHHQLNLPSLAQLLTMLHPAIGQRIQTMMNMDSPQVQIAPLCTQGNQLMQQNR